MPTAIVPVSTIRARQRRQRGAAIITALVVVAAATVALSGMLWQSSIAIRKSENQATASQARWLAFGALDWARLVLREDARSSSIDQKGEFWAVPLAETRITESGIGGGDLNGDEVDVAWLSGNIRDAQSHLNLANLVNWPAPPKAGAAPKDDSKGDGSPTGPTGPTINAREVAALARLLVVVGQSEESAGNLTLAVARRMISAPQPVDLDDLTSVLGRDGVAALRPFAIILPRATPVNVNTAPAEVLAARYENLPLERARALAESRDHVYFNQISDAPSRLSDVTPSARPDEVSVSSHYFEVEGRVRQGRAEVDLHALVERDASGATRVISWWQA